MSRSPRFNYNPRNEAGFTLIEMLVAIALLAMLAALLAAGLRTARLAVAFVAQSNAAMPVQAAQAYLRSALEQARTVPRAGSANQELTFLGSANAMIFTTSHAPRGQYDGLYRVEISLERSADRRAGLDLVVIQSLARPPMSDAQAPPAVRRRARLLDNIQSADFSYFGGVDEANRPQWRNGFADLDKLPRLVAIDVRFADADPRTWHPLIVPLYVSDSASVPCPPRAKC